MPAISSLTQPKLVTTAADIAGVPVTVTFDRNQVTLNWLGRVQAAMADADAAAISQAMSQVIHDWDIVNDDGTPWPPTADHLGELPAAALGVLTAAIEESATPGAAEGNASANISSTANTASETGPAPPPNGQPASPSPQPSASPSLT